MAKTIKITSGKGFKYMDEACIFRNSRSRVTIQVKHVPNQQTGEFHHLELIIRKYEKKPSDDWDIITEPCCRISLKTSEKNNEITDNSVKELFQLLEAQRGIAFKDLQHHSTLVIDDTKIIEQIKSLNSDNFLNVINELSMKHTKETSTQALRILVDKSELEMSEIIKLGFTPKKLQEKKDLLNEFKILLKKPDVKEVSDIQRKLSEMPWLFGPEYVEIDRRGAGEKGIPDFRLKRIDGLSDILEVKLPDSELLREDDIKRQYLSPALAEALGQLTGYLEYYNSMYSITRDDESGNEMNNDFYGRYYKPKGILLIGRRHKVDITKKVNNTVDAHPKLLRKVLSYFHWIEVLTYDDLLERAENSIIKLAK